MRAGRHYIHITDIHTTLLLAVPDVVFFPHFLCIQPVGKRNKFPARQTRIEFPLNPDFLFVFCFLFYFNVFEVEGRRREPICSFKMLIVLCRLGTNAQTCNKLALF